MTKYRTRLAAGAMGIALALGGCGDQAPTGQVVATVDGEAITRRDMAAELQAAGAGKNIDLKAVQPVLIDRLVNRKLMVAEAKEQGIEKTPEYLAQEQRLRETLLAQLLAERWASKVEAPDDAAIAAFIAQNPLMFGERKQLAVDQIRTNLKGIDLKALEPLTTNDQVAQFLQARKHPFQRGRGTLDTIQLPAEAAAQILRLPPGMPFVAAENGLLISNAVIAMRDAPVPAAQRAQVAKQVLQQRNGSKALENQVKSLKLGAKLDYQPGFAPVAPKAGAGAPKT